MANFHLDETCGRFRLRLTPPRHMEILYDLWKCRPAEEFDGITCPVLMIPAGSEAFFSNNKDADVSRFVNAVRRKRESFRDEGNLEGDCMGKIEVCWFRDCGHDIHAEKPHGVASIIHANIAKDSKDRGIFVPRV